MNYSGIDSSKLKSAAKVIKKVNSKKVTSLLDNIQQSQTTKWWDGGTTSSRIYATIKQYVKDPLDNISKVAANFDDIAEYVSKYKNECNDYNYYLEKENYYNRLYENEQDVNTKANYNYWRNYNRERRINSSNNMETYDKKIQSLI